MKHRILHSAPLLPLAICMIAGIIVQQWLCLSFPLLPFFLIFVVLSFVLRRWRHLQSIAISLSFMLLGAYTLQLSNNNDHSDHSPAPIVVKAQEWRSYLLRNFQNLQADDDEYAVLAAMTLGDKSAMTRETRELYSKTGASHVLALSGLHLGIIYMLLIYLMPGRRKWWGRLLLVLSIWAFALLTGLSNSIIRSATMISIYAVFSLRAGRQSSVNVLAFAALVMLLINPHTLFDIGFQMSFMAVLAILLIMPLTEHFVSEEYLQSHPLLKWLWGTVAVSTAAQIGVSPLIAYYFGRFSTYFLLTNLIVIPAVTVILYGSLLFFISSWTAIGMGVLWIVTMLNRVLEWTARLPMASIDGLHPSAFQVVLIYVVFAALYLFLVKLRPIAKD